MLIIALVLAAVGLAALVAAVVTNNEVLAFVCIAAAAIGVVLMVVDAIWDRHAGALGDQEAEHDDEADEDYDEYDEDYDEDYEDDGADQSGGVPESDVSRTDPKAESNSASRPVAANNGTPESSSPTTAAVSLKEAATAAHHPTAEETYERFDDADDEDTP